MSGIYIGTEFVTPDLDVDSAAYKRWGRLKILMLPYNGYSSTGKVHIIFFYGAIVIIILA